MSKPKILHVVPESLLVPRNTYLGSTKDIRGRTDYFQARGVEYEELFVKDRSDQWLKAFLKEKDLSTYTSIFYELPIYPHSMAYVRKNCRGLKQIARSIAATFYHEMQYFWAEQIYSNHPFSPRTYRHQLDRLHYAFHRLKLDFACGLQADFIAPVAEWESRNYFSFFVAPKKIRTLPYFLPEQYMRGIDSESPKKDQCVCLMSSTKGASPFLQDALYHFSDLVQQLGNDLPSWRFIVTGDLSNVQFSLAGRVQQTGFLESPFPTLAESRVLTNLSNYGMGFKTKLLDAILTNSYVFIPKKSYDQLPSEIMPYSIVVDLASVDSFKKALECSRAPFPKGDPNAQLKTQAYSVMDKLFLN